MPPLDDLPEATRDTPLGYRRSGLWGLWGAFPKGALWVGLALLAALFAGVVGTGVIWYQRTGQPPTPDPNQDAMAPSGPAPNGSTTPGTPSTGAGESPTLLGHRAYTEAPASDLVPLSMNGEIRLRTSAAGQFEAMVAAARQEGVTIVPLSGYRSQSEQEAIFFGVRAARGQDAQTRAEVSAPPGYSEHHTGYAIDLGDGNQTETHLEQTFENTDAYRWMVTHAGQYGFELSFPRNNPQQVAFEPWHWRFTGDRESLEVFYQQ